MKPFKTIEEQFELLKNRGMEFKDPYFAKGFLLRKNYYNTANVYGKYFVLDPGNENFKPVTPYNEPIGYGKVISGNLDSWDNMFVNNQHIILSVNQSFKEAKSTFKFRIKQAINPVYWFEIILLFPEYIVKYFGYNSDNFIIKFLNLIWWLFGGFYAIYADKINPFIQDFLSNVFK